MSITISSRVTPDTSLDVNSSSFPGSVLHSGAEDEPALSSCTEDESPSSTPMTPKDGQDADPMTLVGRGTPPPKRFGDSREQEFLTECIAAPRLFRQPHSHSKRHDTIGQESSLHHRNSLHEVLPWNTQTVKTRKISDASSTGQDRKGVNMFRRASATGQNPPHTILERRASQIKAGAVRRPSEMSIRMRRESIAEKFEMEHTLSRPSSPASGRPKRLSPSVVRKVSTAFSSWSSDDDDVRQQEDGIEELVMEDVTAQLSTARRVSRTDSATLPIYLNKTRSNSLATTTQDSAAEKPTMGSPDVVKLVTALQATHLEETRRLNEIIASLSTKVATLDNELFHLNARNYASAFATSPSRHEHAWRSGAYHIDSSKSNYHEQQQPFSDRAMKHFDPARRMSAISAVSASPRSMSFNHV